MERKPQWPKAKALLKSLRGLDFKNGTYDLKMASENSLFVHCSLRAIYLFCRSEVILEKNTLY